MSKNPNRRLQRTINMMNNVPEAVKHEIDVDLKSINSCDFIEKRKKLTKVLLDEDTSHIVHLKIANFFCNKLAMIYRIPPDLSEILVKSVYGIVFNGVGLPTPTRLRYLRFQNENVPFKASLKLYENNVRTVLDHITYFQILKYILRNSLANNDTIQLILNEFEVLFANNTVSQYIKMEIADIFLLNQRVQRGNEMLAALRGYRVHDIKNERTVYDDSQNVHDTKVNKSVLKAACRLIEIHSETEFDDEGVKNELIKMSPLSAESVIKVLERIEIDTSRFAYDNNRFSLYAVFANLWRFICLHKHEKELKIRLLEEIISMALYCSTGHLSRFINVIQGYTEDPDLCIRISDFDQIKAVVSNMLQKVLMNAPEDVMDSMIDVDQTIFVRFVAKIMNEKIPDIVKEYGDEKTEEGEPDIYDHILSAVVSYTKYQNFFIAQEKLEIKPEGIPEPVPEPYIHPYMRMEEQEEVETVEAANRSRWCDIL